MKEKSSKITRFYTKDKNTSIICPCKGKFGYHCGNSYCTINNIVCDQLNQMNLHTNMEHNKCLNDNQIIKIKKL